MPTSRPSTVRSYNNYITSVMWDDSTTTGTSARNQLMRTEYLYVTLQAQGRSVFMDGINVYEELSDGTTVKLDEKGVPILDKKSKNKVLALDFKAIQFELEDCLLHLMKGQPSVMEREFIGCEQTLGDIHFRHNYERSDAENQQMYYIKYKGRKLAIIRRYPHKRATIYKQTEPKYLLVQRLLERVLYYSLPEMKVEVI